MKRATLLILTFSLLIIAEHTVRLWLDGLTLLENPLFLINTILSVLVSGWAIFFYRKIHRQ